MQTTRAHLTRVPIRQEFSSGRPVRHGLGHGRPTPASARFAPLPSIRPTKRRCFGSVCRKISISLSSWWSEVVPIGWPRPAGRASAVIVLVISGHFDGSTEFYSDQVAASEFLPVAEMERASCSDSCPGLFSQLKEVYLFGCNTLNADAVKSMSSEVGRSLVRAGHSKADAERLARTLDQRHGESSRDRMRRIFMNVPVIYGFSSVAPLGPTAATLAEPLLAAVVDCGGRQRSCESQAPRSLCHRVHDRRQWLERCGSARRLSARGLPIRRRPIVAGGETRLHPRPPAPRHGGSPHVPRAHRRPVCVVERKRAASPGFLRALGEIARDDVARDRYLPLRRTPINRRFAPA